MTSLGNLLETRVEAAAQSKSPMTAVHDRMHIHSRWHLTGLSIFRAHTEYMMCLQWEALPAVRTHANLVRCRAGQPRVVHPIFTHGVRGISLCNRPPHDLFSVRLAQLLILATIRAVTAVDAYCVWCVTM